MTNGLDVSYAQGTNIDWHSVYKSGERFVWFKVNEGDVIDKTTTPGRVRAAKDAGLLVGGYNFVRPKLTRRGSAEFDIFYKRAQEVGLLSKGCLRPVIDFEVGAESKFVTKRYVSSWIKRALKRTGKHPVVYTGYYFWNEYGFKTDFNCKLWIAAYDVDRSWVASHVPHPFKYPSFWQYSGGSTVPGISAKVDRDVYLGRDIHTLRHRHTL